MFRADGGATTDTDFVINYVIRDGIRTSLNISFLFS